VTPKIRDRDFTVATIAAPSALRSDDNEASAEAGGEAAGAAAPAEAGKDDKKKA
jgi:large subunit ribosomal protein L25